MAIVFSGPVNEIGPNRLRYLITSPDGLAGTLQLPNANGPSPDIRLDASPFPLTRINGIATTPVASQADARTLMNGENQLLSKARAHTRIFPRTGTAVWSCDADLGVGPSAGFAVINVAYGGGAIDDSAYLEIEFLQAVDFAQFGL